MRRTSASIRHVASALTFAAIVFGWASAAHAQAEDGTLWVEGESAKIKNVQVNSWYSDSVRKSQMSGGAWLSHFSASSDGTAQYDLQVPKDGDYTLWVRGNPVASALGFQVTGSPWVEIDTRRATDVINIADDDQPDLRFLGWMNGGKLALKKGPLSITFKMHSGANHHGAIDCFTLTTLPYEPRGKYKPGEVVPPPSVPVLGEASYKSWIDFIRPSAEDTKWERLGWRTELGAAVLEARKLQRPVLLWAMNGHPLGCT
jgi:hypothetical protein